MDNLINLQELNFDCEFSQPIDNVLIVLKNLKKLSLSYDFDKEIILPPNIKILSIACNNQNLMDSLPNTIEILEFQEWFDIPMDNLPNSIKKITIYYCTDIIYSHELNNLPRSLELLELPINYKLPIKNIPENCKIVYHNNES